jgi:CRISPR-associated protein Csb1
MEKEKTLALRRYILGLSLVAFVANPVTYLRAGCNLVASAKPREFKLVRANGQREDLQISPDVALAYATAVANAFGVALGEEVTFDPKLAVADVKGEGAAQVSRTSRGKKAAAPNATPANTEG